MSDSLVLIKYLDEMYNSLDENSLKVSTPNTINDPFELMIQEPEINSREQVREFLQDFIIKVNSNSNENIKINFNEQMVDQFISNQGSMFKWMTLNAKNAADFNFISFSSKRANPQQEYLLWSLYASKPGNPHCGIRLHFDSETLIRNKTNFKLIKIIYSKERLKLIDPLHPLSSESQEMFMKLLSLKSGIWSHECEYRLIIYPRLDDIWEKDDKRFISFPQKSLKKIIFGFNFDENKIEEIRRCLSSDNRYNHVKLFRTELHPRNFELRYIKI